MKCGYCKNEGHNSRTCGDKKKVLFMPARFPQKFNTGELVMGCPAPPRWDGEKPRADWTNGVLFHVLSEPLADAHSWGGLYDAICLSGLYAGKKLRVYGDFLRPFKNFTHQEV